MRRAGGGKEKNKDVCGRVLSKDYFEHHLILKTAWYFSLWAWPHMILLKLHPNFNRRAVLQLAFLELALPRP